MKKNGHGKRKRSLLTVIGLLLIAAALGITAYNLILQAKAYDNSNDAMADLSPHIGMPDYHMDHDIGMPVITIGGIDYVGIIELPELDLKLPVISKWSYPGLRIAPCRYAGTPYSDDFVIAAHNFSTHFGRIGSMKTGSRVTFTDVAGNVFEYSTAEVEILKPVAVKEMKAAEYPLTLFTCTIGGATRVTVRCEKDSQNYDPEWYNNAESLF